MNNHLATHPNGTALLITTGLLAVPVAGFNLRYLNAAYSPYIRKQKGLTG
ncbi:hypothetical protein [Kocuria sp. HSID16901]|nr:hypothetical protein [Kocuria sp. HSID16901]